MFDLVVRVCYRPALAPALLLACTLSAMSDSVLAQSAQPVTIQSVKALAQYPVASAPATSVSLNDARISAEIAGVIKTVAVRVGDRVAAGATLVSLDCDSHEFKRDQIRAQLAGATARKELADYQLEQVDKLKAGNFASAEEIMRRKSAAREAAAQVAQLNAAVREAENLVKKCTIEAPFDAVVIERTASPGNLANPGTPLLRLVDRNELEVSGQIQEQDAERLRAAERITFVSASGRYPVELRAVVPVIETRLRSFEARFVFSDTRAAPGEAGRIEWRATQPHLPASVLVRREGTLGVFTVADGRARFHPLPAAREGYPAPVELPADAAVIIDGRFNVADGARVEVLQR
ncbi:MAG: efflux RND transporter periplasmic adaptor subunit [Spongiibacteraceae bacterium]|jgi:RND family efflux transporter MFP subunit|nr:efflux RND transporter periplasmic adaptor subunit [Spongiibacteraceae bacterium]